MNPSASQFLSAEKLLGTAVSTELEFHRLIHDAASQLVTVDAFYLCRVQRSPDWLHFVYNCEGDRFDRPDPHPFGNGPTSWVANNGKPKIILEPKHAAGLAYIQFANLETVTCSAVHWPMWIGVPHTQLPDGVLSIQAYAHHAYDEEALAAIEWLVLRATELIQRRRASLIVQAEVEKAERKGALNRAATDAQKFNAILDDLSLQVEKPAALLRRIQSAQVDIAHWASGHQDASDDLGAELAKLSDREIEVLVQVSQGKNTKSIGQALFISEHTVKRHLDNIYHKTRLKKRSDVIAAAMAISQFQMTRLGH